jgi:uncharacterized protein YkwD
MAEKPLFKENLEEYEGLLRANTIGLLLIAFLAVKVFIALVIPQSQVSLASDLTTDNILRAVNQQRSLRNLVTLNTNNLLEEAAQSKTDDMQARHYFAHVDPGGHYIWDKIVADGYTPYLELGENLAIEFYDTDSLISAWMNSPTHRENLLNDGFKDQGMGLTFGNTALNQYHSAIANTFGTLAPVPKPKTPVVPTKPAATATPKPVVKLPVAKTTKPKTLDSEQTSPYLTLDEISPTSTPVSEAAPTALPEPILPRADLALSQNPNSNFTVPSEPGPTSPTTTIPLPILSPNQTADALIGQLNNSTLSSYEINRYLILFAGFFLLMIMLSDIKTHVQNKFGHLDKKVNNLTVLLISLAVIAFMYWL